MSDRIRLVNIVFYGRHGVDDSERALGRRFAVDVELELDLRAAAEHDELAKTADYAAVYRLVHEIGAGEPVRLVETLAERIAQRILAEHGQVQTVTVRARKQEPPVGGLMDHVEVELTRTREG